MAQETTSSDRYTGKTQKLQQISEWMRHMFNLYLVRSTHLIMRISVVTVYTLPAIEALAYTPYICCH